MFALMLSELDSGNEMNCKLPSNLSLTSLSEILNLNYLMYFMTTCNVNVKVPVLMSPSIQICVIILSPICLLQWFQCDFVESHTFVLLCLHGLNQAFCAQEKMEQKALTSF